MIVRPGRPYSTCVTLRVNGVVRRAAGVVLAVALVAFAGRAEAQAASSSFTLGDQSVVQVWVGNRAQVDVRAWDRPSVQFDTDDENVQVTRRPVPFGTVQNPLSVSIPLAGVRNRDPDTGAVARVTLPPEEFPYAPDFRAGVHDTTRIVVGEGAHVTVMVPASVAILDARVRGAGILSIAGYHGGTLFVSSGGGTTTLIDVSASAAFMQVLNGRVDISDSSFERLRARGNTAAFVFARDRAQQIEVTTISGPIVYDDGIFAPGLARFESTWGSIAIGTSGGAQISARTADGHLFSLWDRRPPNDVGPPGNEANLTVNGGGPVVSATTQHGNVFLYDGSLATRRPLPLAWRRVGSILQRTDPAAGPAANEPPADRPYRNSGAPNVRTPVPERIPPAFRRYRELRPGSRRVAGRA